MNTTNIIGNPNEFAIEYSILLNSSPPFGKCRLWFENKYLGNIEEEIYLSTTCYCLESVLENKNALFLNFKLDNIVRSEIFNLMLEEKIDNVDEYLFIPISGYDAFYKYVYRKNNYLYFVWMLNSEIQQEKEYQGYTSQICSAKIGINIYEEVVSKFRKKLEEKFTF